MECIEVDPTTDPRWERLALVSDSDVFHSPAWARVLQRTYQLEPRSLVMEGGDGEARSGVAFCLAEGVAGPRLVGLPFSDFCDPLVEDRSDWDGLVAGLAVAGHPILVRTRRDGPIRRDGRFEVAKRARWHGLELSPGPGGLWEAMASPARRAVRKASQSGVEVRLRHDEEALRIFYDLHLAVRKRKYRLLAQPYRFFEVIGEEFLGRDAGLVALAYLDGEPVAGVVFLEWKDRLYYKFNASRPDALAARPNDLIVWTAVEWACDRGLARLDFGLSDWEQESLARYKAKFGAEEAEIAFLEHTPSGFGPPSGAAILAPVMSRLTDLLTDEEVPDRITREASDLLYRYFV